jgi:phosphoenolpyruvate---glycerone phosphotransferase subunit DhaL
MTMHPNDALDLTSLANVLTGVCDAMVASIDDFTHADQAIGDGDHGLAIGRGFRAAREAIASHPYVDVGDLFEGMGLAMLTSMGGASGAIYGTLFRRGGRGLHGRQTFDAAGLALFLEEGLAGVRERGEAKVGDKTLVDALEPASLAARASTSLPLPEALAAVAEAAADGLERTRGMRATLGKARTLGDRAIGHVDPGALSFTHMVRHLSRLVGEAR